MSSAERINDNFVSGQQHNSTDLMRCRICKSEYGEFMLLDSAFDDVKLDVKLLDVFNEYCGMEAEIDDELPQMLCQKCIKDLEYVREFVQKVKQADYYFRYQSSQTERNATNSAETFDYDELKTGRQSLAGSASSSISNDDVENLSDIEEDDRLEVLYEALSEISSIMETSVEQKIESNSTEDGENNIRLELHNAKSSFICKYNQCEIECSSMKSFQEHLKLKHTDQESIKNQKQYKCEKCDKIFKTNQKLKQHDLVHTRSKDYECPMCSKRFATKYRQRDHLRMHDNIRNFPCEYCDKRFTTRRSLQIHLPLHTGERPHKCDICGKSFVQRSVLTTHQALHTGKRHKCPHCPKMFCRSSQVILHQRSHTGERPYKCSDCDCAYTQKSHLDRHVSRMHLGIQFKCEKCDKIYTAKSTLMTHVKEEHGDKLHKCIECNLSFGKKKNFQYHMKTKHCHDKD